jgi:hypothetical protein
MEHQMLRVMVGLAAERVFDGAGDERMELPLLIERDIPGLEGRKVKAIDLVRYAVGTYEGS